MRIYSLKELLSMQLCFLIFASFILPEKTGTLSLQVEGLRNLRGQVLVTVYDQEKGFPTDPSAAVTSCRVVLANQADLRIETELLPHGTYAVALLHDENANGIMDTNLVGIPKEGYATSNNIRKLLSAPSFEEARFELDKNKKIIHLKMVY